MDAAAQDLQCEIRVRGLLGETLLAGFPGFRATERDGETLLAGTVTDQAALFGVLAQVEALGLELLEVRRRGPEEAMDAAADAPAGPVRDLARERREAARSGCCRGTGATVHES